MSDTSQRFRVGNRVKVVTSSLFYGRSGEVVEYSPGAPREYKLRLSDDYAGWFSGEELTEERHAAHGEVPHPSDLHASAMRDLAFCARMLALEGGGRPERPLRDRYLDFREAVQAVVAIASPLAKVTTDYTAGRLVRGEPHFVAWIDFGDGDAPAVFFANARCGLNEHLLRDVVRQRHEKIGAKAMGKR